MTLAVLDSFRYCLGDAQQLILVQTPSWKSVDGRMHLYDRKDSTWVQVGKNHPVAVGASGMAWGVGLHSEGAGPTKKEGDKKTPAGVFRLPLAFGFSSPPPAIKLPYLPLHPSSEAIDDPQSRYYNTIVDARTIASPDWSSSEKMYSIPLYKWGVVIDHNPTPSQAHLGSCIFIHLWHGPGKGTAGCTTMSHETLQTLLAWLDPAANPLIIQLPQEDAIHD